MKLVMTVVITLSVGALAARAGQTPPPASPLLSTSAMRALQCEQDRARAIADGWNLSDVHLQCEPGVTPPARKSEVKPRYTVASMRAKIQGSVELAAIVEAEGVVRDVRIVKSLDATFGLDGEALKAVRATKFKPGTLNGKPVRTLVTFELYFSLK